MELLLPADVLIPVFLLAVAVAVHLWRWGSHWPAILAATAVAVAVPLATYVLARPIYHFALFGFLLLVIVTILRSRDWWWR